MFAHLSKSDLIYINDIIKDGKIQTKEIYHRLKSKAGYIFEIQTIKSCSYKVVQRILLQMKIAIHMILIYQIQHSD